MAEKPGYRRQSAWTRQSLHSNTAEPEGSERFTIFKVEFPFKHML